MRIKISFLLLTVFIAANISSCKKEPGDGGMATIHGKVFQKQIIAGFVVDSGYVSGNTVFLSYGTHTWEDQNNKTSYTGEYAFPYLHPGDYTVWILTKCDTCHLQQGYCLQHITINKPRETVEVPDLIDIK